MAIIVFTVSGAPRAWRVLLGLTFKGIAHEVKKLEASKREHKSPEYLKIHSRGTIPAADADGLILRDSIGVLAWLDREYPDRPLFGESSTDAAHIWQRVLESSDYLRAAVNDVLLSLLVQGKSVSEEDTSERKIMLASAQKLRDECQVLYGKCNPQCCRCGVLSRDLPDRASREDKI